MEVLVEYASELEACAESIAGGEAEEASSSGVYGGGGGKSPNSAGAEDTIVLPCIISQRNRTREEIEIEMQREYEGYDMIDITFTVAA